MTESMSASLGHEYYLRLDERTVTQGSLVDVRISAADRAVAYRAFLELEGYWLH